MNLKRRILKLFGRQPFEDVLFFHKEGFKITGVQPNVMNILTTYVENVCIWYDGTARPRKGHHGDCTWKFDGQIYWHDIVIVRHGFVSPRPPKIYDIEKGEQPITGIKITGVNKVIEYEVGNE